MNQEKIVKLLGSFEVYLKSERVAPTTLRDYMSTARNFLSKMPNDDLDELAFRTFQANHYGGSNNTALKNHYVAASLYKSLGIPFNVHAPDPEDNPNRPTIKPDDMKLLIVAMKAGGNSTERGLLALSSMYGLRRIELRHLERKDINFDEQTITIRAAKKGRIRAHLIPDCVFDFITNYDYESKCNTDYANIFKDMVRKSGLILDKGFGWHSIRRAVYTGLVANGVDYFIRHEFMRWRSRELDLDLIYSQNTPAQIDTMVFERHPFLSTWDIDFNPQAPRAMFAPGTP